MIQPNTSVRIEQVFAPDGPLRRGLVSFEQRPEQVKMACAVHEALHHGRHLAVEAGTGIGKSFAYLIPAISLLGQKDSKILVSTFTITLQEQLINKDIPFLAQHLPEPFVAQLAKGRANYLCKRRLDFARRRSREMFTTLTDELAKIALWASRTKDGSLSDIPFVPSTTAWDAVKSEHGNCTTRRCQHFGKCFYHRARRKLENADIIVANHALMFSDLVLKEQGFSLLPDYEYVIIDEAHNIENVAQEHFGIDISNRRVKYLLDRLYNTRTRRGFLAYNKQNQEAIELIAKLNAENRKFFNKVRDWYLQNRQDTLGRCYRNFVEDNLSGHLKILRKELSKLANSTEDIDQKYETIRFANLCAELLLDLNNFLDQKKAEHVYWVEAEQSRSSTIRLKSAPLSVAEDVKRTLFDAYEAVILTSATLTSDGSEQAGDFDFFAGRIGLQDHEGLKLGSPFDYERQVKLYIEKLLPDPNEPQFIEPASEAVEKYVLKTRGKAFVLFTSYDMLDKMAEATAPWFKKHKITLLRQGRQFDRTALLKKFRTETNSVLFATDSFWQGVDVPGKALSNVIIVRLPFAVPNHPLIAGRIEQIRQRGGNPFHEYQLPSAVLKFKQGFGRLIRTKTDTGIVVVLDSRIVNKSYGQRFLAAVGACGIEIVESNG